MGSDEFYEYAAERKRNVDDQSVFIAAKIKDHSVIAHEIDGVTELSLYLGWICPTRFGCNREPGPDWAFGARVT